MKYDKPEMIHFIGMNAAGICNNGSVAEGDPGKCDDGGSYSSDSCHSGDADSTGGCFTGNAATGLTCAAGGSATAGIYGALCVAGGDYV